jgi:uncharacterized RDD family membrane protein YckC
MSLKDRFGSKRGNKDKNGSQGNGSEASPLERYLAKKRDEELQLAKKSKIPSDEKQGGASARLEERFRAAAEKAAKVAKQTAKDGFDSVLKPPKRAEPPPTSQTEPHRPASSRAHRPTGPASGAWGAASPSMGPAGGGSLTDAPSNEGASGMPPSQPSPSMQPPPPTQTPPPVRASRVEPGPFWPRFVAALVDGLIVRAIEWPCHKAVMNVLYAVIGERAVFLSDNVAGFFYLVTAFFYFGWFYSQRGASPGKLILDLEVVVDPSGARLGYWRAFFRETLGKFLSGVPLAMGFILAALRSDRRALHDLIFETRVIRRRPDDLSHFGSKDS